MNFPRLSPISIAILSLREVGVIAEELEKAVTYFVIIGVVHEVKNGLRFGVWGLRFEVCGLRFEV